MALLPSLIRPVGRPVQGMAQEGVLPPNLGGRLAGMYETRPPLAQPPRMMPIQPVSDTIARPYVTAPPPGKGLPFGQPMPPINPRYEGEFDMTRPPARPPVPAPTFGSGYGLSGAEQALIGGGGLGAGALQQGQAGAIGSLLAGFGQAQDYITQGVGALQGGMGGIDPRQALSYLTAGGGGGAMSAAAQQTQAASLDPRTGQQQFQQGVGGIQAYSPAGLSAQQQQAALSGALGREAQAQAFRDFTESPEQAFLRQRQQEALINQASATGGLGGGRVLTALQEQAAGLAAQDLQNRFNRLGALSQQGLQAAGQAGQLLGQAGQLEATMAGRQADLQQQAALQNAQLGTQAALQNAQLGTQANLAAAQRAQQMGSQAANLFMQGQLANQGQFADLARAQAGLYGQGAGLAAQLAGQGANIYAGTGQNLSNLFTGTGQQLSGLRFGAGRDIANQIAAQTGALSGLQQQQGVGLSDLIGSGSANLINLLTGAGGAASQGQQNLATILANLATGAGSATAQGLGNIGLAQAQGALGQGQAQQNLLSNLLFAAQQGGFINP